MKRGLFRKVNVGDSIKLIILKDKLSLKLFKSMYRIRSVEEEIAKRYQEGKMRCPTHLSIGQEAVPAAFSQLASKKDFTVRNVLLRADI